MTPSTNARRLGLGLRHVVRSTDRLRAAVAAELGIGITELTALGHLKEAGPITHKALAAHLGITPGTLTGVVDRLVTAGMVVREAHPHDRRSVLLRLTQRGEHARHWAEDQFDAVVQRVLDADPASLGAPEAALLDRFLDTAAHVLQDSTITTALRPRSGTRLERPSASPPGTAAIPA